MPEPLSTERIAEIKASIERAHTEIGEVCSEGPRNRFRMSIPANPARDTDLIVSAALEGAEELLAEVDRLRTPPPPGELRGLDAMCAALHAATETDPVVKEVAWRTFALIRAHREQSAEVDRLKAELEANRQRWYHDDQSRTECVAGHDLETRQCAEGGGRVFSEVEYLTQLVEIWTGLTRSCEGDVTQLRASHDQAESRIAEALDLASRLDPSCGRGRVQAFVSDLRRALGEAVPR